MKTRMLVAALSATLAVQSAAFADNALAQRGTQLYAVVNQRLDSKTAQEGQSFVMPLKDGFFHKNPADLGGAVIEAHVQNVVPASPTHKATMDIVLDDIKLSNGATEPIAARLESLQVFEPHTHHIRDAGLIIGGAISGHVLASHRGMKHGGLAGAAAGFALASSLKSNIVVKAGTQVRLKLTQAIETQ